MMKAISWLLEGDIFIQYMIHRDLIGSDGITLSQMQKRIPKEGFGAKFLSRQNESGHWGVLLLPAQMDINTLHAA
ncbi:MAG: hypothetical protein PHP07_10450 [Eubacteriales bacterium]|nr:hypothetical protein [Eubacteriales bacterium]